MYTNSNKRDTEHIVPSFDSFPSSSFSSNEFLWHVTRSTFDINIIYIYNWNTITLHVIKKSVLLIHSSQNQTNKPNRIHLFAPKSSINMYWKKIKEKLRNNFLNCNAVQNNHNQPHTVTKNKFQHSFSSNHSKIQARYRHSHFHNVQLIFTIIKMLFSHPLPARCH